MGGVGQFRVLRYGAVRLLLICRPGKDNNGVKVVSVDLQAMVCGLQCISSLPLSYIYLYMRGIGRLDMRGGD